MKYLNQSILLITITTLSICNCVLAQTKPAQIATTADGRKVILKSDGTWEYQPAAQTSPTNKESVNNFDTKPFDLKQEKLPPNYRGHDAELLFSNLYDSTLYMRGNEKIADFNKRLQDNKELIPDFNKKMGELKVDSTFAFQANILPKYDSEAKIIKPSILIMPTRFSELSFLYSNKDKQIRSFAAQNAYGAQVTVNVIESESFRILTTNSEKFSSPLSETYVERLGANFEMDSETASQIRRSLMALIICKLVEPYGKYAADIIEPTFSKPNQTQVKEKDVVTEILEIWYYEPVSGKIYHKQKPK